MAVLPKTGRSDCSATIMTMASPPVRRRPGGVPPVAAVLAFATWERSAPPVSYRNRTNVRMILKIHAIRCVTFYFFRGKTFVVK
jgi:hypothetical protein